MVKKIFKDTKLLEEVQNEKQQTNIEHVFTKQMEAESENLGNLRDCGFENNRLGTSVAKK